MGKRKLEKDETCARGPPSKGTSRGNSSLKQQAFALLSDRKKLPIWQRLPEIEESLRSRDVLLLAGETGSGKSTQVPQCLLGEPWCKAQRVRVRRSDGAEEEVSVGGRIAVTEPRRVAAISLARRVAAERGTPLGNASPASEVGYAVRFERSVSPNARIVFLTEGVLLRELLRDPWLRQYSAVVVDEVHERGVDVDLVLGFLQRLLTGSLDGRGGVPLKVIIMSATADLVSLQRYFAQGYADARAETRSLAPASISEDDATHSDDEFSSWSGFSSSDNADDVDHKDEAVNLSSKISVCNVAGRQHPVDIQYLPQPAFDLMEAALRKIFEIHSGEALPGDILVFMAGQEDIEMLQHKIEDIAAQIPPSLPKLEVLPLFAALPQAQQEKVFRRAPDPQHVRRVILSTNIAETSVTVPGVRYVVDGGKAKLRQFRSRLGLDTLLAKPVSQSSALQRAGRAGREAPGKCFRLYTAHAFAQLDAATVPEMLRCDLAQTMLLLKARGVHDVTRFPFLSAPPRDALEKALLLLHTLGALDDAGAVTPLGAQMARLPLAPTLSRVLLAAAAPARACLLEVIDIVACLSVDNVFVTVLAEELKAEADAARKRFVRREGDHLTLLATVQEYVAEAADRRAWARRHFVSHRAMRSVMDIRKQLQAICRAQGLLSSPTSANGSATRRRGSRMRRRRGRRNSSSSSSSSGSDGDDDAISEQTLPSPPVSSPERAEVILKCFLAGFAGNTARLSADGRGYATVASHQPIAIHPSSTLFGRRLEAIMYNEYVFTSRGYAKCVSAIQMSWLAEALGV